VRYRLGVPIGDDLRERREAVVRAHLEAEGRYDIDAALATFSVPRYDVVPLGEDGRAEGVDAVRGILEHLYAAFPDFAVELGPLRHADDAVLVEARNTGTHLGPFHGVPATGRPVDYRVACVFEFHGDQLVRERIYYDVATILRQVGALA
jgi:steroid delta-isomerase-like uncharacterized protein